MSKPKTKTDNSVKAAVITTIGAIFVALISTIFSPALLKFLDGKTAIPSTETAQEMTQIITQPPVATVSNSTDIIFDLNNANSDSFVSVGSGKFNLVNIENNKVLQITSDWSDLVYITQELPDNFIANIRFQVQDSENEFIIGIGNGGEWQYTYAVSVTPSAINFDKRNTSDSAFERLLEAPILKYRLKKDVPVAVQFQRQDKSFVFIINGDKVFEINRSTDTEIDNYNFLFVNSDGKNQPGTIIIDKLVITQ